MPAILKIGYDYFLVKTEKAAMDCLKALSDAIPMDRDFVTKVGEVYYPEPETKRKEIGLTIVSKNQLMRSKPGEEPEEKRPVKLLDYNGPVRYHPDTKAT